MEAIKAVTSPWVKNAVLNERVWIPELGSVQGCESWANTRRLRSYQLRF